MLRHCTSLLVHIGAVVLGPYFSHIAVCDEGWQLQHQWCPAPYVMAIIYSIICMLLLNVQVRKAAVVVVGVTTGKCQGREVVVLRL
jgi:hypothetical protein